jgi:hypothetical protein
LITLGQIDTLNLRNRNEKNTVESCNFLRLLLNEEVLAVSFRGLPVADMPEMKSITDTLKRVASECPHLEILVYEEPEDSRIDMIFGDMYQILRCTLVLKQLQVFDIFKLVCTNLTLALIADDLPRLR